MIWFLRNDCISSSIGINQLLPINQTTTKKGKLFSGRTGPMDVNTSLKEASSQRINDSCHFLDGTCYFTRRDQWPHLEGFIPERPKLLFWLPRTFILWFYFRIPWVFWNRIMIQWSRFYFRIPGVFSIIIQNLWNIPVSDMPQSSQHFYVVNLFQNSLGIL